MAETNDFNFLNIRVKAGNPCTGGYILEIPAEDSASYQWYKNGIALVSENRITYNVPDSNSPATYNVQITKNGTCKISEAMLLQPLNNIFQLKLPTDTFLCKSDTLRLGTGFSGITYSYNESLDNFVKIYNPGVYYITANDNTGCKKVFTVNVASKDCAKCTVFIPNAFSPNNDKLNDVLKGSANCGVDNYYLQVYDSWGEKIFKTSALVGWDGTYKGRRLPSGEYVYVIRYKISGEKSYKILKVHVMLLR